jgi:ribonuclease G
MAKELIVSVNGREKKIAIVEDDLVTEFYVERGDENQGIVGNIYKGRVMKVLPGMQSAFVDIGLERDSFLYVSDFFDEDMDDEVEEKREPQRPAQQKQQEKQRSRETAPSRPVPVRELVVAEEDEEEEEEDDLQIAALTHIKEISEEPVMEPAPDDEPVRDLAAEEEAESSGYGRQGSRRRRQRRLRYSEDEERPAEKQAEVAPAAAEGEEVVEAEAEGEVEAEEESSGRRRRRPRRRRGGDAEEADVRVGTRVPERAAEPEYRPYVILHHEPLERITDDDIAVTDGEMLKDAMVQDRISGRLHTEQRKTELLEVEPTPDIEVGSLRHSLSSASDFERVVDELHAVSEEEQESAAEMRAEAPVWPRELDEIPAPDDVEEAAKVAAEPEDEGIRIYQWADATDRFAIENRETAPLHELMNGEAAEPLESAEVPVEAAPAGEEESSSEELEDANAELRGRPRRGEMATRRGGRGRRRSSSGGGYRQRSVQTDATAEAETQTEQEDEPAAPAQSIAAPPRSAERSAPIVSAPRNGERSSDRFARPVITDLLREGQEIIVQIAKEPIGQKGARITSHVALPGRYIVYMPTVEHIGVSRKIGTDEERQRLKRTLQQLRAESGAPGGFIVRTAANGCTNEELREDMHYLIRTWTDIRRRSDRVKAPAIVHRDLDLVQRILRDQLSSDFNAIRVDNEIEYERIVDFINRFAPKLVSRVKLYTKETPILESYGVQSEIDKAVKPRVWLKSGGYIVINQTEALVAIDVNTGKFVGKSNRLEDTIVKTNLEAAKEIVRQIRLRDLGGIIVLDFIDMEERKNRQKVMQALEHELRSDRSPSKILQFNDFGLVAITRKRVKQSLERTMCTPCNYCGGAGMVKSAQTVCYEILAESRRISKAVDSHSEIILRVAPEVAKTLRNAERDVLAEIEVYLGGVVTIKSDPTIHQEQFDIALA